MPASVLPAAWAKETPQAPDVDEGLAGASGRLGDVVENEWLVGSGELPCLHGFLLGL